MASSLNSPQKIDPSSRVTIIDLMRFLSIFLVMGLHFFMSGVSKGYPPGVWIWIARIFSNGTYGVNCFFVISGFVITQMLIGETREFSLLDLKSFYVKRIARLFPLLFLILIVGLFILVLHPQNDYPMSLCYRGATSRFGWDFWASIFSFTFNWFILLKHQDVSFHWGVLWTLAVEEQFYFLYPLAIKLLKYRERVVIFLSAVWLSGPLFRFGVFLWAPRNFLMSSIASFAVFDQLAAGALLYFLFRRMEASFVEKPWLSYFFLVAGWSIWLRVYFVTSTVDTGELILAPTCLAVGCAFIILGGIHIKALSLPFWKTLSKPGQWSYGAYLWHVTVLFLLWPLLSSAGIMAPVIFCLTVGLISYASFHWFEKPANRFIRRSFGLKF